MNHLKNAMGVLGAAVLLAIASSSQAAVWTLNFNNANVFDGTPPPLLAGKTATDTWAVLSFTDYGTNYVDIKLNVLTGVLQSGIYVNDWWFNGNTLAQSGTFSKLGGVNATASICNDCATGGGSSGKYDGVFHFANASPGELGQGHESIWRLTVGAGNILSVGDFQMLSALPGNSPGPALYAAAHVQGYNNTSARSGACNPATDPNNCDGGGGGGSNEAPEPATLAITGAGLIALALMRRRRPA